MTDADISFSCEDCELQDTPACQDCVVSFVLDREPEGGVVIDAQEARAIRLLARAGLVPELRHSRAAALWATG